MQAMKKRVEASRSQRRLLQNHVFLLGRETPIYILQHLILSFGGDYILQDDLPEGEKELAKAMKKITHICMDRPAGAGAQDKSKEYVQPQYIVDSINNLFLLPTKPYQPGQAAPAHLSPFIDNEEEGYMPDRQREINSLAGIESNTAGPTLGDGDSSSDEDKPEEDAVAEQAAVKKGTKGDVDSSSEEEGASEELSDSDDEDDKVVAKKGPSKAAGKKAANPKEAKKI